MHLIALVSESIALWYGGFKVLSWARKCKIKKFACACQILRWANCHGNSICMFCWVYGYCNCAMELSERLGMANSCSIQACWHQCSMSLTWATTTGQSFASMLMNIPVHTCVNFPEASCIFDALPVAPATSTTQMGRHLPKRVTSTDQCASMTIHTSQLFRI